MNLVFSILLSWAVGLSITAILAGIAIWLLTIGRFRLAFDAAVIAGAIFAQTLVYQTGVSNTLAAVHRAEQAERQRQDAETALAQANDRERARVEAEANDGSGKLTERVEAKAEADKTPLVTKDNHDHLEAIR